MYVKPSKFAARGPPRQAMGKWTLRKRLRQAEACLPRREMDGICTTYLRSEDAARGGLNRGGGAVFCCGCVFVEEEVDIVNADLEVGTDSQILVSPRPWFAVRPSSTVSSLCCSAPGVTQAGGAVGECCGGWPPEIPTVLI